VLVAIRDAESRTRFLGYRVERYKVAVFTFSAVMAGSAGALYVPQVGIINPGEFAPANSIEAVIWGRGRRPSTLIGGDHRRDRGQSRQDSIHQRPARALAVRAGRALHLGDVSCPRASPPWNVKAFAHVHLKRPVAAPHNRQQRRRWNERGVCTPALAPGFAALSRRHLRQLRRLQGVERLVAGVAPGEDAGRHRPQRRRQDHDDGRHHRKTRPDTGTALFRGGVDLTRLDEAEIASIPSCAFRRRRALKQDLRRPPCRLCRQAQVVGNLCISNTVGFWKSQRMTRVAIRLVEPGQIDATAE